VCSLSYLRNMQRTILSSVALTVSYFSTLCHEKHDFRKNVIEYKMCLLICRTTFFSATFVVLRRVEQDVINPLNPELNLICYLLALLAHHFLHVSRIRVKSLTLRLLMSYIYIYIYIYIYSPYS
jgi:hypothetical protein